MDARTLERMPVSKLKEEALKFPEQIKDIHGMNKGQLVAALKQAHGIPVGERRRAPLEKGELKRQIRALKLQRNSALEAKERKELREARRQIKRLKRKLSRAS